MRQHSVLVLGIGNTLLTDEGAGVHVVYHLSERHPDLPGVREALHPSYAGGSASKMPWMGLTPLERDRPFLGHLRPLTPRLDRILASRWSPLRS